MPGYYAPNGRFEATENGKPIVGAKLWTYLTGTTTPAPSYQDVALGTANTNPVICDVQGRATVILDPAVTYDFVLQRADGSAIWTATAIAGVASLAAVTAAVASEAAAREAGDATVTAALQPQITALQSFPWYVWVGAPSVNGIGNLSAGMSAAEGSSGLSSAYNSTTGVVTIVDSGVYRITGLVSHNGADVLGAVSLFVNGTERRWLVHGTYKAYWVPNALGIDVDHSNYSSSFTTETYLTAGQTVTIQSTASGVIYQLNVLNISRSHS